MVTMVTMKTMVTMVTMVTNMHNFYQSANETRHTWQSQSLIIPHIREI